MSTSAPASGDQIGHGADNIKSYIACHHTLDTPELLENILLHLPMRDLLLDQRVCKTWKACVDSSIKLQRGLFFKPAGKIIALPSLPDGVIVKWSPPDDLFINPLLLNSFGSFNMAREILQLETKPRPEDRFMRADASWRRMLFTQPPQASIDMRSRILQAQDELIQDDSPEITAMREALDPGADMPASKRSEAILEAIRDHKARFFSILPLHIQQPIRQAFEEDEDEHYENHRQILIQMLQGTPVNQVLDILLQLSQFMIFWVTIHDAIMPAVLSATLLRLPRYKSAKQLEGV